MRDEGFGGLDAGEEAVDVGVGGWGGFVVRRGLGLRGGGVGGGWRLLLILWSGRHDLLGRGGLLSARRRRHGDDGNAGDQECERGREEGKDSAGQLVVRHQSS